MVTTAHSVQMNVRIDKSLKESGDRVLALAGLSPSDAVRKLWKLAINSASDPKALEQILSGDIQQEKLSTQGNSKLLILQKGRNLAAQAQKDLRISGDLPAPEESFETMREEYLYERLEERGLA